MEDILEGPPSIPKGLDDLLYYKLATKKYFNNLKALIWIFIQIMSTLLVLGIIWITIDWVKIIVTAIAISISLILIFILIYIF
jgi:hypothetical protein